MSGLSTELITKGKLATNTVNKKSQNLYLEEKKKAHKSELWT